MKLEFLSSSNKIDELFDYSIEMPTSFGAACCCCCAGCCCSCS